jgi:hypothetical protein
MFFRRKTVKKEPLIDSESVKQMRVAVESLEQAIQNARSNRHKAKRITALAQELTPQITK